ncbi:MAG: hypothetical protein U0T83_10705 [Bacteriovoracaceae bacterium]
MKNLKLFFVTLFFTITFSAKANQITLKAAFAMNSEAFASYYKELSESTIEKLNSNSDSDLTEKIKGLLLNHQLNQPLASAISDLQSKTITFAEFKTLFSEIIWIDTLFTVNDLKSRPLKNYNDLANHKNILTLDFIYKKTINDLNEHNILEVLTSEIKCTRR